MRGAVERLKRTQSENLSGQREKKGKMEKKRKMKEQTVGYPFKPRWLLE